MQLGRAIKELQDAEVELAAAFRKVGDRHAADHDVFHLCRTLAEQCDEHAAKLVPHGERYSQGLDEPPQPGAVESLLGTVRRKASETAGRLPQSGKLLLDDLRGLYLLAEECLIDWTLVLQGAKAARDRELLETAAACMNETEVQTKWLKTRLKTAAPQVLTVG
jgi:hypothetical protein